MRLSTNGMETQEKIQQQRYANILEDIGNGNETSDHINSYRDDNCGPDESIYILHGVKTHIVNSLADTEKVMEESLEWLYPNGMTHEAVKSCALIVGTNKMVDQWNAKIQENNPCEKKIYYSVDKIADIDDDKGILKEMLTTKLLNSRKHASAPNHQLEVKKGDICILTRYIPKFKNNHN
jgi:hypothetical protein